MNEKIRNMSIVCAFWVVMIHCRPDFPRESMGWWARQFIENGVAAIAVPFFFTVSGYFIAQHLVRGEYVGEVKKRMRTLLVPYFFWNAFLWLVPLALANAVKLVRGQPLFYHHYSLVDWGLWPYDTPGLSPLWYVRDLFLLVLVSPILMSGLRKFGRYFLAVLFLLYGLICPWTVPIWGEKIYELTRCGILPVLGIFYFTLGMAIRVGMVREIEINAFALIAIGLGAIFCCAKFNCFYFGFLSIPFMLYGIWRLMPESRWPRALVAHSFSIYVLHKMILLCVFPVVNPSRNIGAYFGVAVIAFGVSWGVSWALHKCFPKFSGLVFGGR